MSAMSTYLQYEIAEETKTVVYDLELNKTWVMKLTADGSEVTAFMSREQLRELYTAIGNAIGFALPSTLIQDVELV